MPKKMSEEKINQTARKKKISEIISADFVKKTDWEPNHILISGEKIYKVNIKGIVVAKVEKEVIVEYVIDDGTGTMIARLFSPENFDINKINVGSPVNIIGKIREFNDERYLNVDVIKEIDMKWLEFHKKEIEVFGKPQDKTEKIKPKKEENKSVKEMGEEDLNYEIIDYVNNFDKGGGVFIEDIISKFDRFGRENIEKIVDYLLKNGYIFEYRKNYFKVL